MCRKTRSPSSASNSSRRRFTRGASGSNACPRSPVGSGPLDELLLHLEVVLDKCLDRFVNTGIGGEAERFGARSLQRLRPAGNDLLDLRIGLPADARIGRLAAGAADRGGHLAYRHGEAGEL